jgi:hypothetical protein
MPRVEYLNVFENERIKKAVERRDRRMEKIVIPADITGQIFIKCQSEAKAINDRIAFLKGELSHVKERIRALEKEARSMCPCIVTEKLQGNLLSKFELVTITNPNQRIRTKKVVDFETAKIYPLRWQQNHLEQEIFIREQEIGQLKRIAQMCGAGDIGLISYLSDAWRSRLAIGASVWGKLPQPVRQLGQGNVIYVDQVGNILPPEALSSDGKPDMPLGQDPKMPGRAGYWRGDHEESLPGSPADRNATFTKPPQVGER